MSNWIEKTFGTKKPVIAMAHVPALPGTPRYNQEGGVDLIVEKLKPDVESLLKGGVDAIMFCNEDDRPYVFQAGIEQIAAMSRVVSELSSKELCFGVDFLWDPMAAIAIANATGAKFIREVLTGVYESDMGLWSPNAGEVLRFRSKINANNIRVFFNIFPEFSSTLGTRCLEDKVRSIIKSCLPDVLLVSGLTAGSAPDLDNIKKVKTAADGQVPVFINTGATEDNISSFLSEADGVIVGSSLKVDGQTWNPVDPYRVERFVKKVKQIR